MTRGVWLYLVGSFLLVALAGCGRGFFSEEREPWRAEAEIACLKSGVVRESPELVRISPISGPGACGADFPLKVPAIGESAGHLGFADEDLRPPASIGNQPRWPVNRPAPPPPSYYPGQPYNPQNDGGSNYRAPANGPISLRAPGLAPEANDIRLPREPPGWQTGPSSPYAPPPTFQRDRYAPTSPERVETQPGGYYAPRLGPGPTNLYAASGAVTIRPAATLACPIVSVLDHWLADSVQPAAQRWFGARVVEIRQISAYSCRGMNGDSNAHISEHAFGNALDIAAFMLADGRQVTVREGWRGLPEEQGFLRDIEAAACQQFSTVLAPGSNAYHHDHIHVDLMRRASRRMICEPAAISGEEVASRAATRKPYATYQPFVTGSLGKAAARRHKPGEKANGEDEFEDD